MADLSFSNEHFPIPHRIFEARRNLTPLSKENQELIAINSPLWKEPPHPHELSLVAAYTGMVERLKSNIEIKSADLDNIVVILRYINSLQKPQATLDQPKQRKISPPLLTANEKYLIQNEIELLKDEKFRKQPDWQLKLVDMLRIHILTLDLDNEKLITMKVADFDKSIVRYIG